MQRPHALPSGDRLVGQIGLGQGALERGDHDGVQPEVDGFDAADVGLDHLTGRDAALSDSSGKVGGAHAREGLTNHAGRLLVQLTQSPKPRITLPGVRPVNCPASTTSSPLTATWGMPAA